MVRLGGVLVFLLVLVGCSSTPAPADPQTVAEVEPQVEPTVEPVAEPTIAPTATEVPIETLALNHIQVIGSHNSYHLVPEPTIFGTLLGLSPELAESIEYSHAPLTEQLESYGIRQFELDVYADPEGSLYDTPAANGFLGLPELDDPLLDQPGFKVMHTQDFDYGTTCLTFVVCITEIEAWSAENPNHLPIVVMVELKSESVPEAAEAAGLDLPFELPWVEPLEPTTAMLEELDAEIRSVFDADRLIEPDDVRGASATLEEAVLGGGWPSLDDARGKVLFAMINGGEERELYIADAPNLEGRAMFTNSRPGEPDAAFATLNDPSVAEVEAAVAAGYLVRTRTDEPTATARANDGSQRDTALASGGHFLSTDYYAPSELFDSSYVVQLPGGVVARCNPISAPPSCSADQLLE